MSTLAFLSPDRARRSDGFDPELRSPLARALATGVPAGIEDLSLAYGKLEARGEGDAHGLEAEVVRITPVRALVLCPYERTEALREELRRRFELVTDLTAALAGLRLNGVALLRRLTDLDLDALPAAGVVARVPALVLRSDEEFRIFFRQELGHYVASAVVDTARGLR